MSTRLGQFVIAAGVVLVGALFVGVVAIVVFLQGMFPDVPHYTSPVSAQADVGATRISVPFCSPNPGLCEGYPRFYRDGRLLLYHDREGLLAFDPATGAQLWSADGEFYPESGLYLTEFDSGAYAYAETSGQIVDLGDGRVVFQGCGPIIKTPRRVRGGLYRVECSDGVFLADLQSGRVAAYAAPDVGVDDSGTAQPRSGRHFEPGWRGPIDQTDDGALALWFLVGEQNAVAIRTRDGGVELWRSSVADAPHYGRIHAERGLVLVHVSGQDIAFHLRNGRQVEDVALIQAQHLEDPRELRRQAGGPRLDDWRGERPGEWSDLNVSASEDFSFVARYQVQVPSGGLRWHRGGYWGSDSLEGGARRLIVTRRTDRAILMERAMESGRTATAGYRTGIAMSPDGRRVAVLPTDGVVRVYEVALPSTGSSD